MPLNKEKEEEEEEEAANVATEEGGGGDDSGGDDTGGDDTGEAGKASSTTRGKRTVGCVERERCSLAKRVGREAPDGHFHFPQQRPHGFL